MKQLSLRMLLLLALVIPFAAACELDTDDEDSNPPTAIVITSTPTAAESGDDSTATMPPADPATATEPAGPSATPEPGALTATPEPVAPTATPADEQNEEARAEIEAIEVDVVALRGLELLEDLDEQVIDRDELARRVEVIIEEEYSPEEARADTLTYWLLRLIPDRSLDMYQLQIDLLSEQIAGYYDSESKELVVVTEDGSLGVLDKITMAHEIVHALQDQHFDLIAVDEEFAVDIDHEAAITALIEGDATLSMTEYMLGYLDPMELIELLGESLAGVDSAVLDSAPRYISEGLLFSYEAGEVFVSALSEEGGYAAIDAAFDDPPKSTEQILHPEKYISAERDEPILVDNPEISNDLGADWELLRGDVVGEWDLQIMLEDNGISSSVATTAAAGWGGSWFDIYESGDDGLALLTTRWDTEQDADEFAAALLDSFTGDAANGGLWAETDRFFSVVASGDTVVMISGTSEAAVSTVLSLIEQTV